MKTYRFLWFVLWFLLAPWPAWSAETVVFEDAFDTAPSAPWTWLREDPEDWSIADGALEITVRPGDAHSVRNALLRPAPDRARGRYAVEVTVRNLKEPTEQYEQAGLTWYCGGEPVFKLVKERVDGQLMIIPGRKPMTQESVQLRIEVAADGWRALFRPGGQDDYQLAGTGELPPPNDDQVSVQCYHGPVREKHPIRFEDFRILELGP